MAHPYKGQARYGLLRYAALLRAQGKSARAETVTKLMLQLDPESRLDLIDETSTDNAQPLNHQRGWVSRSKLTFASPTQSLCVAVG